MIKNLSVFQNNLNHQLDGVNVWKLLDTIGCSNREVNPNMYQSWMWNGQSRIKLGSSTNLVEAYQLCQGSG